MAEGPYRTRQEPRNDVPRDHRGDVVVGIDGSEFSEKALRWAVQYAAASHVAVRAVSVCSLMPASPFTTVPAPPDEADILTREHEHALAAAVERADPDALGVTVHTSVLLGQPGQLLCALAAGAPALVLGSHGRGPIRTALLGSVSTYCVRHATCPVIVLPPPAVGPEQEAGTDRSATLSPAGGG